MPIKPNHTSERAFFNLQLSSALAFIFGLALLLTVFFIYQQWHAYQQQAQAFRAQFTATQFAQLNDEIKRETRLIQALIDKGQFDETQQTQVLNRLRETRIGPEQIGYFFVLKLNYIDGGADFARHLLLPIDPTQEGQPMDSSLKDSQGHAYRETYLKQLKESGAAKVAYWYQKPGSQFSSQKITLIEWVKPINWIIGAGLYTDDIDAVIYQQQQQLKANFVQQASISLALTLLFIVLASIVSLRLQARLKARFAELKSNLTLYHTQLETLNQTLESEVAQKTQALEDLYQHDALTGLFNRAKLLSDLAKRQNQTTPPPCLLISLNIDDFKALNELFGMELGDQLLITVSENLKAQLPNAKRLYRIGGDEFLVWMPNRLPAPVALEALLQQLHQALTAELKAPNLQSISFNLTIVATTELKNPLGELEMAMRHAKQKKKDVLIYSAELDQKQRFLDNLHITQRLKQALANDQVVPYFQPIYNLHTQQIDKFECLIRIQTPTEVLLPYQFLPVAKKSKLYGQLMQTMLIKSFAMFANNQYRFSVNLSYEDIVGEDIPNTLERLLTPDIAPRVIFEILETEGVENYQIVSSFIQKVKALGCQIAVDDYGTGFSSLEHLLKLNIDILKIDGSLIQSLPQPHAMAIVQSVVFFAKQLNITTVAEFVSRADLLSCVNDLQIDYAQGFYIGQPQPTLQTEPFKPITAD